MKKTITKLMAALALLLFVAPPLVGWGQTRTDLALTFSLTSNPGGWPTTNSTTLTNYTYTLDNVDYTFALKNVKCNSGYLMMTQVAVLGLPAIEDYKLTTVVASNSGGCSTSTKVGISSSANSANYIDGGDIQTWSTTSSSYTYNLTSTDANTMYYMYVTNKNAQVVSLTLTYSPVSSSTPSITAENVELVYYATEGAIGYTINNGVEGGELSAEVTEGEWLENLQVGETVTFNCDPNQAAAPRTATVTLTYTYGDSQTVTKNVTVTQAGNPDVINNIEDITATGAYTVQGTIVAMSTRGFVLGDGTGYVYYYYGTNFSSNYTIGDKVKLAGDVSVYGGVYQYTSSATITAVETSNYEAEDPTILSGSDMDARVASTTPPQLSTYVQYVGTLTISGTYYNITGIDGATTAKGSISYPTNTDFTSLNGRVVTVTGYYVGVSSNQYYNTMIGLIEEVVSSDPSIDANNVEITYDTDADEIEYTINNPVAGGVLTAASQSDWLMVDEDPIQIAIAQNSGSIEFLCDTNDMASARTATVTLTYSYGDSQSTTKDVTVTQAGNPNIVDLISDITEVGTAYTVRGTVVATNSRGFIMGDGTGYVYYYKNGAPTQSVGDMVRVYGTTGTYGHIIQFTNSATIAEATASNYNGTPAATVITEVPDYTEGYHLSDYFEFDGAMRKTGNNYFIAFGDSLVQISYPTTAQGTTMDDLNDKQVHVKGYFSGINSSGKFTVMLESVEEIVSAEPSITVTPYLVEVDANEHDGTLELAYVNLTITEMTDFGIQYYDAQGEETSEPDWIEVLVAEQDPTIGEGYVVSYYMYENTGEARSAYFKVFALGDEDFVYSNLVTINQAEYVVDYATLPFGYEGNGQGTLPAGLTVYGTGTYNSSPMIQFNNADSNGIEDYVILKINEEPGVLTFDIKGNGFSGGTFRMQTSVDGITYTDKVSYTEMPTSAETQTISDLASDVRYIKWSYTKVNGNVAFGNITLAQPDYTPSITVAPATVNVDAAEHDGTLTVTYENIPELISFDIQFCDANGNELEGDDPDWIGAEIQEENDVYSVYYIINANEGEARSAYFKVYTFVGDEEEVYSNLVTINQEEYVAPQASITFDPDFLIFDAELHYDGALPFTYENIIVENNQSFGLQFYTAEGEETGMPGWFYAMVTPQTGGNDQYQVSCATMANEGEARSVYFKVYALDADSILVYSNLATVTQAAPVYDYAVLPFVWEGGSSADFLALNGVTAYGLGGDYASGNAPYLIKFDGTGDYIQVKTDSQPGMVTINVKMIGGSNTSTITIQGSADGVTFTDIDTLTISGAQNDTLTLETTNVFDGNDRYVRMLFTKGSNVGVGPITITKGTVPSITLTPDIFELEAVGPLNGMHLPSMMVSYHNFEITQASDFNYQFYNAEGEEQEMPEWILHSEVSPITDTSYQAICIVTANDGPARSAYFKVYAYDADSIPVYSNLVTFNQAAGAYITVNPDVVNVDAALHAEQLPITYENIVVENYASFDVQFYNAEGEETAMPDWLVVMVTGVIGGNDDEYQVTCAIIANEGEARTTYFKVYAMDAESNLVYSNLITINQEAYVAPSSDENYVLFSGDLVEGDYVIYYNGYAMKNVVENSRLSYSTVTPTEDVITNPASDIVWHIAPYGEYWTIYNAELDQFAASTGAKNKAQLMESGSDDKALWTVTDSEGTYEFVNKKNSDNNVNANLRNNGGYGFACYASTTGGALSLYKCSTPVSTFTKEITGYGDNEGGYYLIASPVVATAPSADNGFLTNAYDLYKFDQTKVGEEWYNYETNAFNLTAGKGYLYASQESTTLTFTGIPYSGDGTVELSFDENNTWGVDNYFWNLVGNPFGTTAYLDRNFYVMNEAGTEILSDACTGAVEAMQGVFVIAEEVGENLTFTTEEAPVAAANVTLNLSQNRGAVIDRAIVRFGEGRQLPKFQLNAESTKLYIPQGNKDYAVVRSAAQGEMPVNFKASKNGSYTLAIDAENVEMNYLHLIDNMTGADIDLLATPSYTFDAKTTDYASRFKLVFSANANENDDENETFAFFNGSVWCISNTGEATLQVVDMLGRIVSSESVNGNATLSTDNLMSGVYMFRLVNGENVKVQKVVVK